MVLLRDPTVESRRIRGIRRVVNIVDNSVVIILDKPGYAGHARSMAPASPTSRRTPARLSRSLLIQACIRIIDVEGVDAVTMRRLGAELDVDPTALYRHFRSKEELLSATADHLLIDALEGLARTGRWKSDLRALALRMRAVYLSYPGLAQLVATAGTPLPNEAELSEAALGILRSAGFSDREAARSFEVLEAYTLAISSMDAATGSRPDTSETWRRSYAVLPAERFPNLTAVADRLYLDDEARFAHGLDLLLDSLESLLRSD